MSLSPGEQTIPLAEAAQRLGVSAEAVRKRLERGTLKGVKRGRAWYVTMPAEPSGQRPDTDPTPSDDSLVLLREQLTVKDQQIERHQIEIERLTVMLADAQGTIRGLLTANTSTPSPPHDATREGESRIVDEKTSQRGVQRVQEPLKEPRPREREGFWRLLGRALRGDRDEPTE